MSTPAIPLWVCLALGMVPQLVLCLLPPALDLVKRPDRVPLWWGLPMVLPVAVVLAVSVLGWSLEPQVYTGIMGQLLLSLASFAVGGVGLLTIVRGLRHGDSGPLKRTPVLLGIAGCVILALLVLGAGTRVHQSILLWLQAPVFLLAVWLVAFQRNEPSERLEHGRAASAGWMMAALCLYWIAVGHLLVTAWYPGPPSLLGSTPSFDLGGHPWFRFRPMVVLTRYVVTGALGLVMAFIALRASGRVRLAPAALATLGVCTLWKGGQQPPPDPRAVDWELPAFVDLRGQRVAAPHPAFHITTVAIAPKPSDPGKGDYIAYPAGTPLSDATWSMGAALLVDDGRGVVRSSQVPGPREPLLIGEKDGRATIEPDGLSFDLDETLHDFLGSQSRRPLYMKATANWTVQDFVHLCASLGGRGSCEITSAKAQIVPPGLVFIPD